jgi:hypothetical protein
MIIEKKCLYDKLLVVNVCLSAYSKLLNINSIDLKWKKVYFVIFYLF